MGACTVIFGRQIKLHAYKQERLLLRLLRLSLVWSRVLETKATVNKMLKSSALFSLRRQKEKNWRL